MEWSVAIFPHNFPARHDELVALPVPEQQAKWHAPVLVDEKFALPLRELARLGVSVRLDRGVQYRQQPLFKAHFLDYTARCARKGSFTALDDLENRVGQLGRTQITRRSLPQRTAAA